MVDPFSVECKLNNYPAIWSYIGLMKCLLEMKNDLNDYLKENLVFEVRFLSLIMQDILSSPSLHLWYFLTYLEPILISYYIHQNFIL